MINLQLDQERDRGVAAVSLLTLGIIGSLAVAVFIAIPLTDASDAKADNRSAADAAALAGVDFVKKDLETALLGEGWLGSWTAYEPFIGAGTDAAESYADLNGAELVQYDFDLIGWQAYAEVRARRDVDGERAVSDATAVLDLPDCETETDDPPPGDPGGDAGPGGPKPPVALPVTITCGDLEVTVTPDDESGMLELPASFITAVIDQSNAKLID